MNETISIIEQVGDRLSYIACKKDIEFIYGIGYANYRRL